MINAAERASSASGNCSSSCTSSAYRHPRHGVSGIRVAPGGEVAAEHRAAQAVKPAIEQGARLLARALCLKTVAGVPTLQRVVHGRQVAHADGQRGRYDRGWRQTDGCRSATGGQRWVSGRRCRTGRPERESTRWYRCRAKSAPARRPRRPLNRRRTRPQCASDRAGYASRRSGCSRW